MPVDTTHPDYPAAAQRWAVVRDVIDGEDAVKSRAASYLPKPAAMTYADYSAYVARAPWFGGTRRTLNGLVGLLFAKPPSLSLPGRAESFATNVDGGGRPLDVFARSVTEQVLSVGRVALLVDVPAGGGSPYLTAYDAESLINWRAEPVDGVKTLTMAVLRECSRAPVAGDQFATEERTRFRLLELVRVDGTMRYVVTVFERRRGQRDLVRVFGPVAPTRRGQYLTDIPLTCVGPNDLSFDLVVPPLSDLAAMNVSHFRTAADLEQAMFYCGSPVLAISGKLIGAGAPDQPAELTVGPGVAIHTELNGRVELLQAGADSVGALRQGLADKQAAMAVIGARLLEAPRTSNPEHQQTVALRHRGEDAGLSAVAANVSRGLTRALSTAAWWSGAADAVDGAATVSLNSDFDLSTLTPDDLFRLSSAWVTGGIPLQVLYNELRRAGTLPPGIETFDEYSAAVEQHSAHSAYGGVP